MFTGIILEVGRVEEMRAEGEGRRLRIAAPETAQALELGGSVAVNGSCDDVALFSYTRDRELVLVLMQYAPDSAARSRLSVWVGSDRYLCPVSTSWLDGRARVDVPYDRLPDGSILLHAPVVTSEPVILRLVERP